LNPDIVEFNVVREYGSEVEIIASNNKELIGMSPDDMQPYKMSAAILDASLSFAKAESGIRYWESYRFVHKSEFDSFYIYTKTSLYDIDTLFASRITDAYQWLIGILIVIILLIIRHVRLIDYAYLYKETKKANEMKDLFTNMIAHELRAPLTAMRGYASIIEEKTDISTEVRDDAHKINEAAQRLVLIVNDLLDVARIQSGKLTLKPERIDIQRLVDSVIDAITVVARKKDILLSREGMKQPLFILIDEKRFFQVLTNLISNAIKYTKAGTITVSLEEKNDRIEIRVKDTGMGISADNQRQLFAPFFRVENTEVDQVTGTGLGMWIAKQFIELMKGSIGVESIKGVGTHVIVTLPK
jgi:signal transduction histidine kinase